MASCHVMFQWWYISWDHHFLDFSQKKKKKIIKERSAAMNKNGHSKSPQSDYTYCEYTVFVSTLLNRSSVSQDVLSAKLTLTIYLAVLCLKSCTLVHQELWFDKTLWGFTWHFIREFRQEWGICLQCDFIHMTLIWFPFKQWTEQAVKLLSSLLLLP